MFESYVLILTLIFRGGVAIHHIDVATAQQCEQMRAAYMRVVQPTANNLDVYVIATCINKLVASR